MTFLTEMKQSFIIELFWTSAVDLHDISMRLPQELQNDKNKTTTRKQNIEGAKHKGRDVSSSKTARSVPQDARAGQAAGEAAWFQSQGEQQEEVANNDSEIQDLGGEEAEHNTQSNDTDSSIKPDGNEPVEQSSTQSWTRRESPVASTSRQQEYDYKELAQEEMIAQKKAKLLQAIDQLPPLKWTAETMS